MGRSRLVGLLCLVVWALSPLGRAWAGAAEPVGGGAVWTLPEQAWSACLHQDGDATGCLARIMRQSGATPQALLVNRRLDGQGYMSAFREMGRVDVATMVFPLRANTNAVTYLVNGTPLLVSSELDEGDLRLSANAQYAALKKAHPEILFWPASEGLPSLEALPGGGQGFVFAYPLLNGCHACEVLGHAVASLDFGPDGVYRGPRLVRVESAR